MPWHAAVADSTDIFIPQELMMHARRRALRCRSLRDSRRSGWSLLWIVGIFLLAALPLAAQQHLSFAGKEFFITFPDTVNDRFNYVNYPINDDARLIFFSQKTAHVTVTAPSYQNTLTVQPDASTVLDLNQPIPSIPPIYCSARNRTTSDIIHIVSDENIIIYCYFVTVSGSEAFTPLPVESWGTEYSMVTLPTTKVNYRLSVIEEATGTIPAPAQTIVIASRDSTTVTIEPGTAAGSTIPMTVTLNAGQAYLFETLQPGPASLYGEDFSGSRLIANHPVGVLSGATRSDGFTTMDANYISGNTIKNTLAEWLTPITMHGQSFVYRPIKAQSYAYGDEMVRLTSSASGITGITQINGRDTTMPSHGFTDYFASKFGTNGFGAPFALQTDRPAQAMVITGSHYALTGDITTQGTAITWTRSMAELAPHERWLDSGRFYTPDYPTFLVHNLSIVADSGAVVLLDKSPIAFSTQRVSGTTFKQALIPVWPGDHTLKATGGRFAAIALGSAQGSEEVRPARTHRDDDGGSAILSDPAGKGSGGFLHRTVYDEVPSLAYAYPVVGTQAAKGLLATSQEDCDSTIVTVRSTLGVFPAEAYPFTVDTMKNMAVRVDTVRGADSGQIVTYRIVFHPLDPKADGFGQITLTDEDGRTYSFPSTYRAYHLTAIPDPIDLQDMTPGLQQPVTLWLRNRNPYPVTITNGMLRSGSQGFRLKVGTEFPVVLAPGDSLQITLLFLRVDYDQTFTDLFLLNIPCHPDTVPLSAHTAKAPSSHLGGVDWGSRWVTTQSPCTRNDAPSYDTTIVIYNTSNEDFTVVSFQLIGDDADAGFFRLDNSDPATTVGVGTVMRHGDTLTYRYLQRVRFLPKDERDYSCLLRLITDHGDTLVGVLSGSGIETHLAATGYTFAPVRMQGGTPPAPVTGTVRIAALPTRPLTVRGLRLIGADASRFAIDPADLARLPRVLAPGEEWNVGISYLPSGPGVDSARLLVIGDESLCEDSTALLAGSCFSEQLGTRSVDLGSIVTCGADSGTISFVNTGTVPLVASRLTASPAGAFAFPLLAIPGIMLPGDSLIVPFHLVESQSGPFDGTVTLSTTASDGTRPADYTANVHADLLAGVLHASADRFLHIPAGKLGSMYVKLDSIVPPIAIPIDTLELRVTYNGRILRLIDSGDCAALLEGTLLRDWSCSVIADAPGTYDLLLVAPPGAAPIAGGGELLAKLPFGSFVGDSLGTEVGIALIPRGIESCVQVQARPGYATLDSICGLSFRLIDISGAKFAIDGSRPNPFNAETDIDVAIGLDGPVRISVTDLGGKEVAVLVDQRLEAGNYTLHWNALRFPSGLYYCRVTTQSWIGLHPMMLVK